MLLIPHYLLSNLSKDFQHFAQYRTDEFKFSHIQSTFRHVTVVATAVFREFTLQSNNVLQEVFG